MESAMQLELFEETTEEKTLRKIKGIEDQVGNMRRGLFQRHNDLLGMIVALQDQVKSLQSKVEKETK